MDERKQTAEGESNGDCSGVTAGADAPRSPTAPAFALIVNADDLGYDARRDLGVVRAATQRVSCYLLLHASRVNAV